MKKLSKNKGRNSKTAASAQIPKFLTKTFEILENNQFPQALRWENEGTAILIESVVELEKVLPCLFKHKNFTSFIRQLNLYGFKKLKTNFSQHIYYHECFQSGKKNLLRLVKRKKDDDAYDDQSQSEEGNSDAEAEKRDLLMENKRLKKLHQALTTRINALENKLDQFAENNALLLQIALKKEKEISSFKNLLEAEKEESKNTESQGDLSPQTIPISVEKVEKLEPMIKINVKPNPSIFQFNCQNSAFVKVSRLKCIKEEEGSDSDRRSEGNSPQNTIIEERKGSSTLNC